MSGFPQPLGIRAQKVRRLPRSGDPEICMANELPFVSYVRPDTWSAGHGRCCWFAPPSGDYAADCRLGEEYALLTFRHLQRFPGSPLVHMSLLHMVSAGAGEVDGVMVGYVSRISAMVNADRGVFRYGTCQPRRVQGVVA